MKTYLVKYYFDGYGKVEVKAKSPEEAKEKWFEGDTIGATEDEWGDQYNFEVAIKIK